MLHCLCVMYIVPTYIFSMHLHKRFGVLQMHLSGSQFAQFPYQYGPPDYVQLSRYRCILVLERSYLRYGILVSICNVYIQATFLRF